MLSLSTKEYDLNTLFSFESLKEILLELAKSQIKLEDEIKNIKEDNKNRDIKILKIIKKYKRDNFLDDDTEEQEEENKDNDKDNDNNDNNENNKNNEENDNKNIIIQNEDKDKDIIIEKEKISEKEGINNNLKYEKEEINNHLKSEKEGRNNHLKSEKEETIMENTKDNSIKKEEITSEYKNNLISPLLFKKMVKEIKEHKAKIISIEESLKNESKNKKIEEHKINNMSIENQNEFKLVNDKINSLIQKNNDIEQKIELLQSNNKVSDLMNMFKDDGSGTIDATKVMVKALQEKVFKKFELVETRYKKDGVENFKTKTMVENIIPKIDKIIKDIDDINILNIKQKEEFNDYKKENEELNNEMKNNLTEDFDKKIDSLKDEINNEIKNKIKIIEDKIKNLNNLSEINKNSGLEKDNFKIIEKKISDLRKKSNDIENTLKLHLKKNEIASVRNELNDVRSLAESKLTKEDIKDLYNNYLTNSDEINDIKDRFDINEEEITKLNREIRTAMQKIEIFQGNLILLQNSSGNTGFKKIVDFSKYVENQKLNDNINPIIKQIENMMKEIESIRRDMNEIDEINKNYIKNAIIKFEEDNTNKMNEFKIFVQKKYLEKYDFNRAIKSIEVQMKILNDDSKKRDADTWLLAKRNTKCFNCASCEANIKNDNYTTADYLAWKKYPKGEKIHRMGQGFSHMLEMMSSEFAKSIERNEFQNENNDNMYLNTVPDKIERASSTKLKINKKDLNQDEIFQNLKTSKKIGKKKLPKMTQSKMKLKKNEKNSNSGNQLSDDDNTNLEIINNNNIHNNNINNNQNNNTEKDIIQNGEISPKIIKIVKKNVKNEQSPNTNENFKTIQEEKSRIEKDNDY